MFGSSLRRPIVVVSVVYYIDMDVDVDLDVDVDMDMDVLYVLFVIVQYAVNTGAVLNHSNSILILNSNTRMKL